MFKSIFNSGIRAVYTVSENPTFNSDPWSIYPAKKNSNGKLVSVFIFDKKKFEQRVQSLSSTSSKNPKVIISECYELIKFEISQSAKLKHPQILTIIEPLEETKSKFLFVSEPVQNNLKTVSLEKFDELTIQKGLLQISKSLQFLHNFCQIIHFNLQPSSIYINDQGDWKLFGFRFLQNLNELSSQERDNFYIMNNSSLIPFTNLNLNFTAPELLLDSSNKLSLFNDIWSLACLIFYVYNKGEYLVECFESDSINDFKSAFKKFENRFYQRRGLPDGNSIGREIPSKLTGLFLQMISRSPNDRITIDQFIDSDFFNGSIIKAMWFVDEFATKTIDEKLIFLKGLLEVQGEETVLNQFPPSFRNSKLLPLLINDVVLQELKLADKGDKGSSSTPNASTSNVANSPVDDTKSTSELLLSLALSIIFKIGNNLSSLTFQDKIYNILLKNNQSFWKKATGSSSSSSSPYKLIMNYSPKVRLSIIENISVLKTKLNDKQLVEFVKNIAEQILIVDQQPSNEQVRLQDLFLTELQPIIPLFDFPYIKNTLFQLVCQVFKTTTVLSTKITTIKTFESFVDQKIIDKLIVSEQLLPILNNLKSRDKLIIGHVLRLFSKLNNSEHIHLELDVIISSILPRCWQLAFGCNNCTALEFKEFVEIVKKVENDLIERKIKLLPTRVDNGNEIGKDSSDFTNLINTQKFNQGNQDQILSAPKDEVMIQPVKRTRSQGKETKPVNGNNNTPVMTPKPKSVPSQRKQLPKTPTISPAPLSFGATSKKSNVNNDALLRTLNSTYQTKNIEEDDDDFDDFQSTTPATAASDSSVIDWNVEMNKTKPMNQMKPIQITNSIGSPNLPYKNSGTTFSTNSYNNNNNTNMNNNTTFTATTNTNYPPGFNSDLVLKPMSKHT
ncbi:protein kinase-like protein Scy1p [[Candida] railenensis]|uniref:Protein kinase-like protein Scy1p n=1 Tax=[Candida] railenensis TaxID=45579 RepID=A0A9P0QJE2_9ASCO|nr:protein kinase-like protein Scy1p [[Candida] railenensis]